MKHTPWVAKRFDESQVVILPEQADPRHPLIAVVSIGEGRPDGEANVRLIVQSPVMYAYLQDRWTSHDDETALAILRTIDEPGHRY